MIIHHRNGVDVTEIEAKLADATMKWQKSKSPSDQAELMRLYEIYSGYKPGCPACIAGRQMFIESLGLLAKGDGQAALAKMMSSFRTVKFKASILKEKLGL